MKTIAYDERNTRQIQSRQNQTSWCIANTSCCHWNYFLRRVLITERMISWKRFLFWVSCNDEFPCATYAAGWLSVEPWSRVYNWQIATLSIMCRGNTVAVNNVHGDQNTYNGITDAKAFSWTKKKFPHVVSVLWLYWLDVRLPEPASPSDLRPQLSWRYTFNCSHEIKNSSRVITTKELKILFGLNRLKGTEHRQSISCQWIPWIFYHVYHVFHHRICRQTRGHKLIMKIANFKWKL